MESVTYTNLERAFADDHQMEMPPLDSDQALQLVESALSNRDPEMVSNYFRLGLISDPGKALNELESISEREGAVIRTQWLGQKFTNGQILGEVVVYMANDERHVNRLAQLMVGSNGAWRIDFDSYLRKVSPAWAAILSGESSLSIVRVFIADDTYYNGIYSDDSKWKAYALASPDAPDVLYGYAERGSRQDRALAQILASEEKLHRTTLEIKTHSENGSRQFAISRVIADNWVIGTKDYDETF
jgi:hypothetical protein